MIGLDIARKLFSGPLASIAQTITSALQPGSGAKGNILSKLFGFGHHQTGRLSQHALRPPQAMPVPFAPPFGATQNLGQSLQNLTSTMTGMQQNFQQLLGLLGQVLGGRQAMGGQPPYFGQQPFFPQPFSGGYERFLQGGINHFGDRAANLTGQAMSLHRESAEMSQARALVQAARPLLLNNNPKDQARGERMLAQAKQLASEDPRLGQMIDQAAKLSRSSHPRDRLKAAALLNRTEKRMGAEAYRDSFAAQQKLSQASLMIDKMAQYASLLTQTQQFSYSSFRY